MPSRSLCLFLVSFATCSIAACDTFVTPPPLSSGEKERESVSLVARGAEAGDFVYSLSPLSEGGSFQVGLTMEDGRSAVIRSERNANGVPVSLDASGFSPDSVTISYLANGVPAARSVSYPGESGKTEGTYDAGTASRGPDSYHWEERDGRIILVKDYKDDASRRSGGTGAEFITVGGDQVRVTDVVFTLHGVAAGSAENVVFEGTSEFELHDAQFQLGQ